MQPLIPLGPSYQQLTVKVARSWVTIRPGLDSRATILRSQHHVPTEGGALNYKDHVTLFWCALAGIMS